jgi:hypothetical protein
MNEDISIWANVHVRHWCTDVKRHDVAPNVPTYRPQIADSIPVCTHIKMRSFTVVLEYVLSQSGCITPMYTHAYIHITIHTDRQACILIHGHSHFLFSPERHMWHQGDSNRHKQAGPTRGRATIPCHELVHTWHHSHLTTPIFNVVHIWHLYNSRTS